MTLASMSVKFLVKNAFLDNEFLTTNIFNFFKQCSSDRSEKLQRVPRYDFEKRKVQHRGILWDHSLKNPKFPLVPLPSVTSNSQQMEKNIVCGIWAKKIESRICKGFFYKSKFGKSCCLRELEKAAKLEICRPTRKWTSNQLLKTARCYF